jgi:hypothetical protein
MSWLRDQARQGMNPRTYTLLALLVVALLYVQSLDEQAKRARLRAQAAGGPPPAPAQLAAAASKTGASTTIGEGWGRDPFARRFGPGGTEAPPDPRRISPAPVSSGLYLQGVMNGPAGRTALINGDVYREGERVGSREILQIGARTVMLLDRGTVTTLTLKGDGP